MKEFSFQALGTAWSILVDHNIFPKSHQKVIINFVNDFEKRYSRFKDDSEISLINQSKKRKFQLSTDLKEMLSLGLVLQRLTDGHFTPNINRLLLGYGYDQNYSFKQNEENFKIPAGSFSFLSDQLIKHGDVQLDLGGVGKGFLIDKISSLLARLGYKYYLVDGGADIFATSKSKNQPYNIAIEHPLNKDEAIGCLKIINQSIATSSSNKRRVGNFHHLLNPLTKQPVNDILSVTAIADSAFIADACATAIFVSPRSTWKNIAKKFKLNYLVVFSDLSFQTSPGFPDVVFYTHR